MHCGIVVIAILCSILSMLYLICSSIFYLHMGYVLVYSTYIWDMF